MPNRNDYTSWRRHHFDPVHHQWYILTQQYTLSVTTETGELLREVAVPCVKKNSLHTFARLSAHFAQDRLLRAHCDTCIVLWDIVSADKEICHRFEYRKLNPRDRHPFVVISSLCDDVSTRKVGIYKREDREEEQKKYHDRLCSWVAMDMDHPDESERREVMVDIPDYLSLDQAFNNRFVFSGNARVGVVQDGSYIWSTQGYGTATTMESPFIVYREYYNEGTHLLYANISTIETTTEATFVHGPVLPHGTHILCCETISTEGDLHILLFLPNEHTTAELDLWVVSMRTGKVIRSWTFPQPDPTPQGMMVCGSEVLIDLGYESGCYIPRLVSFQIL